MLSRTLGLGSRVVYRKCHYQNECDTRYTSCDSHLKLGASERTGKQKRQVSATATLDLFGVNIRALNRPLGSDDPACRIGTMRIRTR